MLAGFVLLNYNYNVRTGARSNRKIFMQVLNIQLMLCFVIHLDDNHHYSTKHKAIQEQYDIPLCGPCTLHSCIKFIIIIIAYFLALIKFACILIFFGANFRSNLCWSLLTNRRFKPTVKHMSLLNKLFAIFPFKPRITFYIAKSLGRSRLSRAVKPQENAELDAQDRPGGQSEYELNTRINFLILRKYSLQVKILPEKLPKT